MTHNIFPGTSILIYFKVILPELEMSQVKTMIDAKIGGKKVVVFSKSYCPYCAKAKKVLKNHYGKDLNEADVEIIEIENNPDCDAIQDYLKTLTGGRSVPRVFINGKCIGGGDETQALEQSGKLSELLQ